MCDVDPTFASILVYVGGGGGVMTRNHKPSLGLSSPGEQYHTSCEYSTLHGRCRYTVDVSPPLE